MVMAVSILDKPNKDYRFNYQITQYSILSIPKRKEAHYFGDNY